MAALVGHENFEKSCYDAVHVLNQDLPDWPTMRLYFTDIENKEGNELGSGFRPVVHRHKHRWSTVHSESQATALKDMQTVCSRELVESGA
jgi:hypothetical protein